MRQDDAVDERVGPPVALGARGVAEKIARSPIPGEEEQVVAPAVSTRALGPSLVHVFDRVEVERLTSVPSDQPRRDVHEEEIRVVGIRRAMMRRRDALAREKNLRRAVELASVEVLVEPRGQMVHVHLGRGTVTAPGGVRRESGRAGVVEVDGAVGPEKAGEASAETFDALASTGAIVVAQRRVVAMGFGDVETLELAELARVAVHAPRAVAPAELLVARPSILATWRAPGRFRVGTPRAPPTPGQKLRSFAGFSAVGRSNVHPSSPTPGARSTSSPVVTFAGADAVFGANKGGEAGEISSSTWSTSDEPRAPSGASPSGRYNREHE